MQFPQPNLLSVPCNFVTYVPGKPHPDGRRYLPLLHLHFINADPLSGADLMLGVVDRHHRVDLALTGREGWAALVLLLGKVTAQVNTTWRGVVAEADHANVSTLPTVYGRVAQVFSVQLERPEPYTLLVELLLDIGIGMVGMRSLLATEPQVGDWLQVERPRIDILALTQ
jgi:hypothetical protein